MRNKTIIFFCIFIVIFVFNNQAQLRLKTVGTSLGVGTMSGNSPQIFSSSLSLFSDVSIESSTPVELRLQLSLLNDFNKLIPENRQNKYYPSLRGVSVQMLFQQQMFKKIYFEEGFGPLVINDRTFSDVNLWSYGAVFSFSAGINFVEKGEKGFAFALISELGNTFTQTTPQYLSIALQLKYLN
ncbi:MAG: hypothetical protein Q8N83_16260 [Ignavibacteria bacterium]|nr:hypothetical protein [Ignavibacteria bacterium]